MSLRIRNIDVYSFILFLLWHQCLPWLYMLLCLPWLYMPKAINYAVGLPPQIQNTIGRTYTFACGLTDDSYRSMESRTYLVDSCVFRPNQQITGPVPPLALQAPPQTTTPGQHSGSTSISTRPPQFKESRQRSDQEPQTISHQVLHIQNTQTAATSTCQTPTPELNTQDPSPTETITRCLFESLQIMVRSTHQKDVEDNK